MTIRAGRDRIRLSGRIGREIPESDLHPPLITSLPSATVVPGETRVALSELVGALTYALDLTEGQPRGHSARTCLIGMRIAKEIGLSSQEQSDLYYALLLKDAGCSSNSAAAVGFFGSDDHRVKRDLKTVDWQRPLDAMLYAVRNAARGSGVRRKLRQLQHMRMTPGGGSDLIRIRCERGAEIVRKMGFPETSAQAVRSLDEHWNGGGSPRGISGEEIPTLARIVSLAQTVEVFAAERGWREALRMAKARSRRWFDPELVKAFSTFRDAGWWEALYRGDPLDGLPGLEPDDRVQTVDDGGIDRIAEAFAEVVDAKSPFTFRHSTRVAELSRDVTAASGASPETVRMVYRAGLLHDIGKLGVSNLILDKPGSLSDEERGVIELHPVLTWSILRQVEIFRPIARMASVHHERLDGTGYPWGFAADGLDRHDRALAVCDIYEALTAERPYKTKMTSGEAFAILRSKRDEVDQEIVEVLAGLEEEKG